MKHLKFHLDNKDAESSLGPTPPPTPPSSPQRTDDGGNNLLGLSPSWAAQVARFGQPGVAVNEF